MTLSIHGPCTWCLWFFFFRSEDDFWNGSKEEKNCAERAEEKTEVRDSRSPELNQVKITPVVPRTGRSLTCTVYLYTAKTSFFMWEPHYNIAHTTDWNMGSNLCHTELNFKYCFLSFKVSLDYFLPCLPHSPFLFNSSGSHTIIEIPLVTKPSRIFCDAEHQTRSLDPQVL